MLFAGLDFGSLEAVDENDRPEAQGLAGAAASTPLDLVSQDLRLNWRDHGSRQVASCQLFVLAVSNSRVSILPKAMLQTIFSYAFY